MGCEPDIRTAPPFPVPEIRVPLIAIRHGQTDWNAEGRLQGQRDIPLNDTGRAQAMNNGVTLSRHIGNGEGWSFVSSPLGRAQETMRIVRGELGIAPDIYRIEAAITEASFGDWEGFTMDELKIHDRAAHRSRKDDRWGALPPNGESYIMLAERVARWLEALSEPTVAVCHGGVIRIFRAMVEGDHPSLFDGPPTQEKIYVIENGTGRWV
ncbi:MAG: histidine phosphatase family protein [Rhodobiaceae bacterium]|nr:histidine phosphatase family protein [Rhodobiaceae bacterium]MCC0018891.1 histidine phosphatase family protein [Rhodobiaceae bacterium]MCC0051218.1 histidine phosphatase family protein [Rhodobiaceae bacterium]MCC0059933.1 histidine phosphatase family protein [Rhodobiaceae bacterium]